MAGKTAIKSGSSLKSTIKDQSGAGKVKIGEILSKEGQITSIMLNEALSVQKKTNERLSGILLQKGYIDPDTIINVLGRIYNYKVVTFSEIKPDSQALKLLPYDDAKNNLVFPLKLVGDDLQLCMAEPTNTDVVADLGKKTGKNIQAFVSTENDIIQAYRDFYKISDEEYKSFLHFEDEAEDDEPVTSVDDFGSLVSEAAEELEVAVAETNVGQDEFMASDAPIIKLVNGILTKAINDGVSDIHIEPFEKSFQVRYRLDGGMYKAMNLPLSIKNAVLSRIKILASLDIAERRIPQDGRIKLRLGK
ncbi:MAG: GspE/PulE family protein, partial [Thermodesulfobacteriota bacterium]